VIVSLNASTVLPEVEEQVNEEERKSRHVKNRKALRLSTQESPKHNFKSSAQLQTIATAGDLPKLLSSSPQRDRSSPKLVKNGPIIKTSKN
jgi:hypothetical protein